MAAVVGSNVIYSAVHEYRTNHLYVVPTLARERQRLTAILNGSA